MDFFRKTVFYSTNMSTLYVLQLTHNKWYVGKTDDVAKRYQQHKAGYGSEWTKIYNPVKLVETREVKSDHDENNLTKDLMKKYGVENVRGGSYSQVVLGGTTLQFLQREVRGNEDSCFNCGKSGHFVKDCPEETDEEEDDDDLCFRCGRKGHWKESCYAYTTVDGRYLGKPPYDLRYDSDSE